MRFHYVLLRGIFLVKRQSYAKDYVVQFISFLYRIKWFDIQISQIDQLNKETTITKKTLFGPFEIMMHKLQI